MAPCACGGERERTYPIEAPRSVQDDSIPGGRTYKHGICNDDGTPRTFYTEHEVRDAMKKNGVLPLEMEVPVFDAEIEGLLKKNGQSRRPLTCSGVLSAEDEAERVRHWHETERQLQQELAHAATD